MEFMEGRLGEKFNGPVRMKGVVTLGLRIEHLLGSKNVAVLRRGLH